MGNKLSYIDKDDANREVSGCWMIVDSLDHYWIWSEQLQHYIVSHTKGRENALLAAIDNMLLTVQRTDERIAKLQRIADLAQASAKEVNALKKQSAPL
jgi:hypothetical protein